MALDIVYENQIETNQVPQQEFKGLDIIWEMPEQIPGENQIETNQVPQQEFKGLDIIWETPEQIPGVNVPLYPDAEIRAGKVTFLDNLKNAFDWAAQIPVTAFQEQVTANEAAALRTKGIGLRMIGQDLTDADRQRIEELDRPNEAGTFNQVNNYMIPEYDYADKNLSNFVPRSLSFMKGLTVDVLKQSGIMWDIVKETGIMGAVGAGVGTVGGVAAAAVKKDPRLILEGTRVGTSLFARTGAAKKMYELEAGFQRQEFEELNTEFIAQGIEPLSDREIDNLSIAVGLINASLEYVGATTILRAIPAGEKLLDWMTRGGTRKLVRDAEFREASKHIVTRLAKAGFVEGTTEFAQEYTNWVYGNIARGMRDVAPEPLANKIDDMMRAALVGAIAGITFGGIGSAAQATTIKVKQGISSVRAKAEVAEMTPEQQADFVEMNQDVLMESIKDLPDVQQVERVEAVRDMAYDLVVSAKIAEPQAVATADLIAARARAVEAIGENSVEWFNNAKLNIENRGLRTVLPDSSAVGEVVSDVGAAPRETALSLNQAAAMYKSPKENFSEFFEQVKIEPQRANKAYFNFKDDNVDVNIPHDTVLHTDRKHSITLQQWESVLGNLSNIENAGISAKPRFNGEAVLLKIDANGQKYGVAVETFQNTQPMITTVFKSTDKGIDAWIQENSAKAKSEASISTRENGEVLLGQSPNDIIADVKEKLKGVSLRLNQIEQEVDRLREAAATARGNSGRILGQFTEYTTGERLITLMQNANEATILHELAHFFLMDLNSLAQTNAKAAEQLRQVNEWLGYNGIEYTEAQHEKFARGFEAYVWIGKAPTPALKRAFEQFKEWVRSIYDSLSDIFRGTEIDFGSEALDLYDSLFAEAFIDQQKAEVKNIFREMQREKDTAYKEVAQRMKDASFDILAKVLNVPTRNLKGMMLGKRQEQGRERVQREINNLERINTLQMYPDWAEFYPNHNVETVEGSRALAQEAFNQIVGDEWFEGEYIVDSQMEIDATIDQNDIEYNYLLKRFQRAKTPENKSITYSAMQEWINRLFDEVQEFYQERFDLDMADIQHIENINSFQEAKAAVLKHAHMILSRQKRAEFNKIVNDAFRGLGFLTTSERRRLFNKITSINSTTQLKTEIDSIINYADFLSNKVYKRNLDTKIQKALEFTKNVKQGARKVGKYDYQTNVTFQELRELNRLNRTQARDKLNTIDFSKVEEQALEFEEKLRNKFLYYKGNELNYLSSDLLSSLYKDIQELKRAGYLAKNAEQEKKKLNKWWDKDRVISVLKNKDTANMAQRAYAVLFSNWESALNLIFNKQIMNEFSLLIPEDNVNIFKQQQTRRVITETIEIYSIKPREFDNKIIDMLSEKYTFNEKVGAYLIPTELNKMQLINIYIWTKNNVLNERLENQFAEQLTDILSKLLPEDMAFGDMLQQAAERYYHEANRVFIKKYGIEMPKVENYFPSSTERVSEFDLLNDYVQASSTPSFTKMRSVGTHHVMKAGNPLQTLFSHIDKMGRYIILSEKLDTINAVFKNPEMKKHVVQKYGENVYSSLITKIANSSFSKKGADYNGLDKILNEWANNWVATKIAIKPTIAIKQFLSTSNFASDMPLHLWAKGFAEAVSKPKETINYMMKIPGMRERFESGGQTEYLKEVIESSQFAKSKKLKDLASLNVRIGDIGAFIFGGKPYVDYLIKERGMSEEAAWEQFKLHGYRTLQAGSPSSLNDFQNNFNNPIVRVLFAFKNQPNQYMRKVGDTIIDYSRGEISHITFAKNIFMYTFFNQFMYSIATSGAVLGFLLTGDDEDLGNDILSSIFNLNTDAIPIIGDIIQLASDFMVQRVLQGKEKVRYNEPSMPILGDVYNAFSILNKKEPTLDNYIAAIAPVLEFLTGIPASTLANMTFGVGDIAQGDILKGMLRTVGYTKRRAERMLGED